MKKYRLSGMLLGLTLVAGACGKTDPPAETTEQGTAEGTEGETVQEEPKDPAELYPATIAPEDIHVDVEAVEKTAKKLVDLIGADVIVSVGRGISKDPEKGIAIAQELADALGGVVGSSRACVDAGYISQDHQVGQTGKTVHP